MTEFCDRHGIAYERCGKVIVATEDAELPRLQALYERGTANGVPGLKMISTPRSCDEHRAALPRGRRRSTSPDTGIVDYVQVAAKMAALVARARRRDRDRGPRHRASARDR